MMIIYTFDILYDTMIFKFLFSGLHGGIDYEEVCNICNELIVGNSIIRVRNQKLRERK